MALTQELRLGVVMYGGSSLAIYINGVAQELLHLVRATAPGPDPAHARFGAGELASTEAVYRRVGQALRYGRPPLPLDGPHGPHGPHGPGEDAPIHTRFVVDLISGSSAGGINGVFLAKALARNRPLDQLTRLWVDEGDFAELVNDEASTANVRKGDRKLVRSKPPCSLLNGRKFYYLLLRALQGMDTTPPTAEVAPLVDVLDLFVTITDVAGHTVRLQLADKEVPERHYRTAWKLSDGPVDHAFSTDQNPLLAFVARSTAAFPFAFEPATVRDLEAIATHVTRAEVNLEAQARSRIMGHVGASDLPLRDRAFGDGGSLDNKPFTQLVSALSDRRSTVPVDRRLLFVEPDPAEPGPDVSVTELDPIGNVLAQALLLPRKETISDDLDRIRERNGRAAHVLGMIEAIDVVMLDRLTRAQPLLSPEETKDRWLSHEDLSVAEASTLRIKVRVVAGDLAAGISRDAGEPAGSDRQVAVQSLLLAWAEQGADIRRRKEFLLRYDFGYRLRRINFVQRRVDELLDPLRAGRLLESVAGQPPVALPADGDTDGWASYRRSLVGVKQSLNAVYEELRQHAESGECFGPELRALGHSPRLASILEATGAPQRSLAVNALLEEERAALDAADARVGPVTRELFRRASEACGTALADSEGELPAVALARRVLRRTYDSYEEYDTAVFPVMQCYDGELDLIEVLRVSPLDATSLRPHELAGSRLGHFGGFADPGWRRHDIMWGRLDAADRLITMLVPPGGDRTSLLDAARRTIIAEELVAPQHRLDPRAVDAAVALVSDPAYEPPTEGTPEAKLATLGRGVTVAAGVLRGVTQSARATTLTRVVAALGRVVTGLAGAAVPQSVGRLLWRHWLTVATVAAALLIVAGTVFSGSDTAVQVRQVGWLALGAAAVVRLTVILLPVALRHPARRVAAVAAVAAVVLLLVVGFVAGHATADELEEACDVAVVGRALFWCGP